MIESRLTELCQEICDQMQSLQRAFPTTLTAQELYTPRKPLHSDSRTLQDSARFFAEKLMMSDEAAASTLLTQDQEGKQSFLLTAIGALCDLDTKLPVVADSIGGKNDLFPYYSLSAYILEYLRLQALPPPPSRIPPGFEKFDPLQDQ
jgi:hypothetical protein